MKKNVRFIGHHHCTKRNEDAGEENEIDKKFERLQHDKQTFVSRYNWEVQVTAFAGSVFPLYNDGLGGDGIAYVISFVF